MLPKKLLIVLGVLVALAWSWIDAPTTDTGNFHVISSRPALPPGVTVKKTPNDDVVYTLYRNSVTDRDSSGFSAMRLHVATFDAAEPSRTYNQENCDIARTLFVGQKNVLVNYWCEKGRYRE